MRSDRFACRFYACPEMFCELPNSMQTVAPYSGKGSDVWSLGIMFYALLVGCYPFFVNTHVSDILTVIKSAELRIPSTLSLSAVRLLQGMLQRDPAQRLTTAAILHHPFLSRRKPAWVQALLGDNSSETDYLLSAPSTDEQEPSKLFW